VDQVDAAFMAGDHNTLSSACHSPDYRTGMFSSGGMRCLLECDCVRIQEVSGRNADVGRGHDPMQRLPRWTGTLRAASFEL
jgi:hypothetical protein